KDEYLAILGHELRNPLGAISNPVAVLRSGHLPEDSEESVLTIIGRQVQHLTKLVGDLLDISPLTSGKIALQPVPTDLLAIAERCLATMRSAGKSSEHDIKIEGSSVSVVGDPVRLEQVLDNLLDNAIKYTPRGGRITVSIGANGRHAILCVNDTGVGIAPELLPRMFNLFTQGAQGPERQRG